MYVLWVISLVAIFLEHEFNNDPTNVVSGAALTFIPAWINNYTHYNVWDEITYPFLNFNGATVEV